MDIEKLLEVIQVQRHDLLNHFQVISGFLQLNKPDRIRQYIELAVKDMNEMSKTTRFKIPEVTAALLVGLNEAAKHQAKLEFAVMSGLDECTVPGPVLGRALEKGLNCFFDNLTAHELGDRNFTVRFQESGNEYTICLCGPVLCIADPVLLKNDLEPVNVLLNIYDGRSNVAVSGGTIEIILDLPRKKTNSGQPRV
jgi:hypothetical protein